MHKGAPFWRTASAFCWKQRGLISWWCQRITFPCTFHKWGQSLHFKSFRALERVGRTAKLGGYTYRVAKSSKDYTQPFNSFTKFSLWACRFLMDIHSSNRNGNFTFLSLFTSLLVTSTIVSLPKRNYCSLKRQFDHDFSTAKRYRVKLQTLGRENK